MVDVSCPNCKASFQLGEEFQGATVQCGACGTAFQVPVPSADLPDIEIICPGCRTTHQVPGNGRGAEAECMICGLTFQIPPEGNLGIATGQVKNPQAAAAAIAAATAAAAAPAAAPAAPRPGGDYKNTSTIRLSRSSLAGNTMQAKAKAAGAPARPGFKPSGPAASRPAAPVAATAPAAPVPAAAPAPAPAAAAPAAASAPAAPAPAPAAKPAVRTGTGPVAKPGAAARPAIPVSTLGVVLEGEEKAVASREFSQPFPVLDLVLGGIPVLMIPVTVWLCSLMNSTALGIVLGVVIGLAAWGVLAYQHFASWQLKNGLLLTTKRAIMVNQEKPAVTLTLEK